MNFSACFSKTHPFLSVLGFHLGESWWNPRGPKKNHSTKNLVVPSHSQTRKLLGTPVFSSSRYEKLHRALKKSHESECLWCAVMVGWLDDSWSWWHLVAANFFPLQKKDTRKSLLGQSFSIFFWGYIVGFGFFFFFFLKRDVQLSNALFFYIFFIVKFPFSDKSSLKEVNMTTMTSTFWFFFKPSLTSKRWTNAQEMVGYNPNIHHL